MQLNGSTESLMSSFKFNLTAAFKNFFQQIRTILFCIKSRNSFFLGCAKNKFFFIALRFPLFKRAVVYFKEWDCYSLVKQFIKVLSLEAERNSTTLKFQKLLKIFLFLSSSSFFAFIKLYIFAFVSRKKKMWRVRGKIFSI